MNGNQNETNNRRSLLSTLHEWESFRFSQKPRSMMLVIILIVNVFVVLFASWVISRFALPGNTRMGFFTAVYNTFTMILDAGCISSVISDPGNANLLLIIFSLVIIVVCMITFTGALIGYATSVISNYIENANANSIRLRISGHVAVLGWNTRATEIINDLLYCRDRQKVVVLSDGDREEILQEITERLKDTIERENRALAASKEAREKRGLKRFAYLQKNKLRNNVAVIVREGDVFSAVHLNNIQLEKAKSIIILGKDLRTVIHDGASAEKEQEKGDSRTIKALIQVADIAGKSSSADNQKVVVEVENEWTGDLVDNIIQAKQELGKDVVVPFQVHTVMGQLLSQFSLMPELNMVYNHLFSNKGVAFYARREKRPDDIPAFVQDYLDKHRKAIPLLFIRDDTSKEDFFYYMANSDRDIDAASDIRHETCSLALNPDFWLQERYILILGSNSKIDNVMDGYTSFSKEWDKEEWKKEQKKWEEAVKRGGTPEGEKPKQIVHLTIVDDEERLKKENNYGKYRFVDRCIPARITDKEKISGIIKEFIYAHPEHSSILILSDDTVPDEDIDAKMMTYLIYAKSVITQARKNKRDVNFNIDIIAEVMDPRHVELVRSYDVDNVVISNRFISKMVTQISEDYARYNLYADIMDYDEMETPEYDGIEIYIKKAGEYFSELPPKNVPVDTLIRSVYKASLRFWGSPLDFAMLLGYINTKGELTLFGGAQDQQTVSLDPEDRLVIFSNH